ncbi:MAG: LytR family transcriptional regulator, partial [Microbacteriaceae bacterium]
MSDLRPRSYSSKKPGTLARHGQLRPHGPAKTLAKFVAAALAVVLVSGASVAAVAVWDVVGNVKPGVTLGA